MDGRPSSDFDDVSDEGSIASLETSSSSSSSALDLPPEWEVAIADDKGRLYYIDNEKRVTSWCPPSKSWKCCFGLPHGWEIGADMQHFLYYINHNSKLTTYKHPNYENKQFEALHQAFHARRRKVSIKRNARDGFGFVAGSEKPVIIRSVVVGSPADGQLFANDQLFSINGQVAYNLPQPQVISMIRSCTDVLEMEVVATEDIQDVRNQGTLKSALMSRATRERRKSCPVSVRFEEKPEVLSLGAPSVLSVNIIKQMIPNVLKIYLENGQTKSFQYNTETTVKEIFDSLVERLQIMASEYFALVLIGPYPNQSIFLQPEDRVTQIVNKKVFSRWECRLELSFVPNDAFELLNKDPVAFDYWYQQTCNSVVKGHFGADLKFDAVMRLAALQIHVAMTNENEEAKFTLKDVSKEYGGLDDFLPNIIIQNFKKKDIKKAVNAQLKSLSRIAFPGHKLSPLQAKLHYLKIASQNVAFGGKIFSANLVSNNVGSSDSSMDSSMDISDVLISPSKGICTLFTETGNVLQHLADLSSVTGMIVTSHMLNKHHLKIFIEDKKAISFILNPQDADDMAFFIERYHKLQVENAPDIPVYNLSQSIPRYKAPKDSKAPSYVGEHAVIPSTWSYIEDVVPTLWLSNGGFGDQNSPKSIGTKIDFSSGPPQYNTQKSYDRSSFVPFRQRPAVDTFIRELSIRDKKKNKSTVNSSPLRENLSPVKTVGHFDTTQFGEKIEEEKPDGKQEIAGKTSPKLTRHIITCSMSSDEDSSDEELSDLAKRINRSGTVGKFLKNKDAMQRSKIEEEKPASLTYGNEDEEDSGWRTDTSSNTGSLGRSWSNPWGTFSEEDVSDKESNKQLTDSDSLLSNREDFPGLEQCQGTAVCRNEISDEKKLHNVVKNSIVDAESVENSPKRSLNKENSHSFDKYLVNKLDTLEMTEDNPLDDLTSDVEGRPPFLRPLSEISDEVFVTDQKPIVETRSVANDKHNNNRDSGICRTSVDADGWSSMPHLPADLTVKSEKLNSSLSEMISSPRGSSELPKNDSSCRTPVCESELNCYTENLNVPSDLHDLEERPQSVNLEDLDIYIPAPPKIATRALSPSELIIPSPPHDFADEIQNEFTYESLKSEAEQTNADSPESSTLSSRTSSSEEVVEFMETIGTEEDNAIGEESNSSLSESPEDEIEFMTPEKSNNVRIYDEKMKNTVQNHVHTETGMQNSHIDKEEVKYLDIIKDRSPGIARPSVRKSQSFNEDAKVMFPSSFNKKENDIRYSSLRAEPRISPLQLPKSPSLELKSEREMTPLFFSVENISSPHHFKTSSDPDVEFDRAHPFPHLDTNKSPTKNERLTLPRTPLSLRRNQFTAFCSAENVSEINNSPNDCSFDEFNDYLDACKNSILKSCAFEEELMALIEENKRADRQSFEGDDPERESYIEMMRTCSRSLVNRTKEIVSMATNGNVKSLHRFVRSSKNEVENLVVAITTVKNSLTLATLIKDVVVGYKDVITCLKKTTGKPLTDTDVVKLIEKINDFNFSSNILVRGLRSY